MSDLAKTKNKKKFLTTGNLVSCAMLSACATILMLFEIPLTFIAPVFYKIDLSELPVLIGAFAMGPLAGVVIELLKVLLNLVINGTETAFVGEIANFVVGCTFVVPAAIIYKHKKTKGTALLSLLAGGIMMSLLSTIINAFVMLPIYAKLFEMPVSAIIEMGSVIFPFVDSMFDFCLVCVLPFNFIKALVVSAITFFIYKPLSVLIKGLNN